MPDVVWDSVDATVPLLLLPVRIETRSTADGSVLRVRIYPDDIHADSHDTELTAAEIDAGKKYWTDRWRTSPGPLPTHPDLYQKLIASVGPRRAPWVAKRLTPANLGQPPVIPPIFDAAVQPRDSPSRVRARLLPRCFHVIAEQGSVRSFGVGEPIDPDGPALSGPMALQTSDFDLLDQMRVTFDTLRGKLEGEVDTDIVWMTDYDNALLFGMAVDVTLQLPGRRIDRLYVVGLRDEDPDTAHGLNALLTSHLYTDGLGFVAPGTVTNNIASAPANRSTPPPLPGEPERVSPNPPDDNTARTLYNTLDIPPQPLKVADGATRNWTEPSHAFATALWPITWGSFLNKLLLPTAAGSAVPITARNTIRSHAVEFVRGRGPLPTLRIGKQPYGVLPVTAHKLWRPMHDKVIDFWLAQELNQLRALWSSAADEAPTVTSGDIDRDLPSILGQLPVSGAVRVRSALATGELDTFLPGFAEPNTRAQTMLAAALAQLLNIDRTALNPFDTLGSSTRLLGLPLAHDSDAEFCASLRANPPRGQEPSEDPKDPQSLLQALLGLAHTQLRHQAEELRNADLWGLMIGNWLEPVTQHDQGDTPHPPDTLIDEGILNPIIDMADQLMGPRPWGDPDDPDTDPMMIEQCQSRAEALESVAGPFVSDGPDGPPGQFDPARYAARFPSAANRRHPFFTARVRKEAFRAAAGAFRLLQEFFTVRQAIATIAKIDDVEQRAMLLAENLDCVSHRLDAWLTSLATARLAALRSQGARGVTVGAFGWVENIVIEPPTAVDGLTDDRGQPIFEAQRDGGYVLAPSPAHATTAAVLRGAYLTHNPDSTGRGALNIDLSSTRVRAALAVIDGMRAGQPFGALLGYRLERWMHEAGGLDRFIYCLRALAPLVAAKATDRSPGVVPIALEAVAANNVVDGVRLLELNPAAVITALAHPPAGYARYFDGFNGWVPPTTDEGLAVGAMIGRLSRLHDAVADLLLAESVHQLSLGAPARASAAMDALSGDALPPDPDVVRTPGSGVTVTHRLLRILESSPGVSGWADGSPTHPWLEGCARQVLGEAGEIVLHDGPAGRFTLADAQISALDVVRSAAANPADDGIELFWARVARRVPAMPPDARPGDASFVAAWTLASSLHSALQGARAAAPADFVPSGTDEHHAHTIDTAELRMRAGAAVDFLDGVLAMPTGVDRVDALAAFGLGVGVNPAVLSPADAASHEGALIDAAGRRRDAANAALAVFDTSTDADATSSAEAKAATLTEVVQNLHDEKLPLESVLRWPENTPYPFGDALAAGVSIASEGRRVSDGRDLRPWLTRFARVRPAVARFTEVLLLRDAVGTDAQLRVAQLTADPLPTWIALPLPADVGSPDHPVASFVVEGTAAANRPLAALVVDQWIDVLPRRSMVRNQITGAPIEPGPDVHTAGVAVNANGPNARAPQCVLLAVTPDGEPWSRDRVVDVLEDTLQMARERAVTLETVPLAGRLLPATYVQDWSLQGEPVLDLSQLYDLDEASVLTHVAEKE